jgi:hypothetical protein
VQSVKWCDVMLYSYITQHCCYYSNDGCIPIWPKCETGVVHVDSGSMKGSPKKNTGVEWQVFYPYQMLLDINRFSFHVQLHKREIMKIWTRYNQTIKSAICS